MHEAKREYLSVITLSLIGLDRVGAMVNIYSKVHGDNVIE